ncbi:CAP domain-containing protein [Paracoccus sp. R86501]|uniref:CAP domain-containing protein n=1 Tax=Paracoccus sp. R86501 TaxID=3101711 RepID=UPI00366D766C
MSQATDAERYFLELVNRARAADGLRPVTLETHLNNSSNSHSGWMLRNDVFSHTGAGGSSASDRVRAADFPLEVSWRVTENLAYVSVDRDGSLLDEVQQLHTNLMNSPGHRANILDPNVEYIGVGLQVGEFDGHQILMATQNFASTLGNVNLDLAAGVTVTQIDRPFMGAMSKANWLDAHEPLTVSASGTAADDRIVKGGADNTLSGLGGDDLIAGGAGDDVLRGGQGHDFIMGQKGNDRLLGQNGDDVLSGGTGADRLLGGAGRDHLKGDGGNDRLFGQAHNDRLLGGGGNDTLDGGFGRDTLIGGAGADRLTGGGGADQFIFDGNIGRDVITDFTAGQDRLLIAEALIPGSMAEFMDDHIRQTADGVVIDLSGNNRILVQGQDLSVQDVADDIFLF